MVRLYDGIPPVSAFASTRGSPLVVNINTGLTYFLHPVTGAVTAAGGGGSGGAGVKLVRYVGDNSGHYTTSSTSQSDIGSYAASIAAVAGDVIEAELTGGGEATSVTTVELAWMINGVAQASPLSAGSNVTGVSSSIFMQSRFAFVVTAPMISAGVVPVKPRWRKTTGTTITFYNSVNYIGLLTLKNFGPP